MTIPDKSENCPASNQCICIPDETMSVFGNTRYPEFIVWSPVARPLLDKALKQVRTMPAGIHRFSPPDEKAVMILPFSARSEALPPKVKCGRLKNLLPELDFRLLSQQTRNTQYAPH